MQWTQAFNPLGNIGLSALVAAIPILFLFVALAGLRMKGHVAGLITLALAIVVAVAAYGMPVQHALLSALYGMMTGLWPIGWIIVGAVFLYNLTVRTGQFAVIKDSIAIITEDRRLQALLIAFSFGSFLEGAAGFGTPVAITAAMLVGLGFNPMYAAGLCLIANTAPVAFGAIGIPIITAGSVTGIDAMAISQMVGRQLPFLSVFVPFWLVLIMSGWKNTKEVLPAILVSGVSFALMQWFSSNYLSPMLPDILSSLTSIVCLVLFLRVWKPKHIWRFKDEQAANLKIERHSRGAVLKAWTPFIVLTVLIADWGMNPVKAIIGKLDIKFAFGGLDKMIIAGGRPMGVIFDFNVLAATGTSILIAAIVSSFIIRVGPRQFFKVLGSTLKDLRFALFTIACVLGFAYVANWSGMTPTMGKAFTFVGAAFPFVSAFLGWLGVFITGSDTSSNALFANLQKVTAQSMGINPVLAIATNSAGGVAGKMISPQSIAVGCASTGLVGREGDLFRFTLPHSLFFTALAGLIALVEAYVFPEIIPEAIKAAATAAGVSSGGIVILLCTGIAIVVLGAFSYGQGSMAEAKLSAAAK
ncbi:MAG: L-lactate permease [Rectinemataceae bacterium]